MLVSMGTLIILLILAFLLGVLTTPIVLYLFLKAPARIYATEATKLPGNPK